ncbi:hypothetical protein BDN71DRAFT_1508056 [Pleurotus eryngii]|uniref:Uncharacterized protein n=1 Tax=Pleurotus eryngii TaxID=5323 RepID=A0A9P5ZWI9_PLEER|nr:hypothetical protein BDN71DRAFT_1508056 [Pleurotus eryngii]
MAPQDKVTAGQKYYLRGLVDMYLETKKHGGWTKFWASTFKSWFKLWPELEDMTILDKAERNAALASAILARQRSIKNWFRNHVVCKAPMTIKVPVAKVPKAKHGPQLLELYSAEYYDTHVTANIAAAAEGKLAKATTEGEGKSLSVIHAEVKKAFKEESVELQAEFAAKHCQVLQDRAAKKKAELNAPPAPPTPTSYEVGIVLISIQFNTFMREVELSGWSFVLLCRGLDPRGVGHISTTVLHYRSNLVGLSHLQYDPNFMAHHVLAFANFLTTCDTPEDCSSQALTPASTKIAAKVSPLPATPCSPSVMNESNENPGSSSPSTIASSSIASNVSLVSAPPVPNATINNAQQCTAPAATFEAQALLLPSHASRDALLMDQVATATARAEQAMEFDWDSVDLSSLPNFNMPNFNTNGGVMSSVYPSLSEELTTPLSDLVLPTPSFLQSQHLLANTPYSFSVENPSLVLPSLSVTLIPQRNAAVAPAVLPPLVQQAEAVHDPAVLPLVQLAQQENADLPPAMLPPLAQQVGPALPTINLGLPPPAVLALLNAETRNRKQSQIDGLDESVIMDTKRIHKSQKRTEVEAITQKLPKGKESQYTVVFVEYTNKS